MAFDWIAFLTSRHIPFVTSGPSVTRGNVAVKCPFCHDDPSEHMAISLTGHGWRCWRRREHSGRSDAWLVAKLTGCSMEQAHLIVGSRRALTGNFMETLQGILKPVVTRQEARTLDLPREFKDFKGSPLERPFAEYLKRRGFRSPQLLTRRYGLRYAMRGPFAYRIIFPIYFEGRLVNWTARSIGNSDLRYKTLSTDAEKADEGETLGVGPISDYLLWWDDLLQTDADTIILTEGPFDALKVNYLADECGVVSTCFFTIAPTDHQIDLLHELLPRFRRRYLLQDAGAYASAMRTNAELSALGVESITLPPGVKDPGELTLKELNHVVALSR